MFEAYNTEIISYSDIPLGILTLIIIYFVSSTKVARNIDIKPYYKYYTRGLFIKLIASILVIIIFTIFYGGGDTTNYGHDIIRVTNVLIEDPVYWLENIVIKGNAGPDYYHFFLADGGYIPIYLHDEYAFFVVKLLSVVSLFCFNSYVVTSLVVTWICFNGVWKLFEIFVMEYPSLAKEFSWGVFFVPTVVFWGSGILKDPITFAAVGWLFYGFYRLTKRERIYASLLYLGIGAFLLLRIKPYIFFAMVPSLLIWINFNVLKKIKNQAISIIASPFLIAIAILGAYMLLTSMEEFLGKYALDEVLDHAVVIQSDLKKDYYGGHRFDIGVIEPTIPSLISKAPIAIFTTLFRPFLWEAGNVLVIFSALESTALLVFALFVFLRVNIVKAIRFIFKIPILAFSFVFILVFSFSVGLTTANFGAMVRYKIPLVPFFVCALIILLHVKSNDKKEIEEEKKNEEFKFIT